MKYKFAVLKVHDKAEDEDNMFLRETLRHNEEQVFSVEITADEMVELMQHLWDISNRRK
ncbi:MAG TPA: hypothetical protein VIW80_16870 [Pyrinomonadaceae bacterium]|jgi:molybdopterin biosynthesis enzyme MoaB